MWMAISDPSNPTALSTSVPSISSTSFRGSPSAHLSTSASVTESGIGSNKIRPSGASPNACSQSVAVG